MVIIGHHFARRLPLRVAGSSSTTATAKLTMHLIAASKHQRCAVRDARGLEPARPPIKCLPCSPSCVYLIHGPYTSQVSAHTRFRAMRDFSICRRSQQHCPPPAQRRARVKFLWCAVCALAPSEFGNFGLPIGCRWRGPRRLGSVPFALPAVVTVVRMHIENARVGTAQSRYANPRV